MTMLFWHKRDHPSDEELSAFLDGELAAARMTAITEHLRICEQCAAALEGLGTTKALVAELPQLQPSRSFMLGPEFARQRPAAAARSPLIFAPAVTLTLFLALIAVDLRGVSTEQSTAGLEMADDAAKTMAAEPEQRSTGPMPASNAGGATQDASPAAAPRSAAATGENTGSVPAATPAPATGERLEQRPFSAPTAPGAAADSADALREEAPPIQPATAPAAIRDATSDDPGWLRPLQIGALIAFIGSIAAVAWPWLRRRGESNL
jgi:hypothetical protein